MKNYIFESERLGFREWNMDDLNFFAQMNRKARVMKYFTTSLSKEESKDFLKAIILHFDNHGYGLYAVEIKENHQLIGFIGFQIATFKAAFTPCVEIGWRLDDQYWKLGYATEGAKATLKYGFSHLNLQRVYSFSAKTNLASIRVMEKIGLKHQEDFKHPKIKDNHPLQRHVLYRITKDEHENDC